MSKLSKFLRYSPMTLIKVIGVVGLLGLSSCGEKTVPPQTQKTQTQKTTTKTPAPAASVPSTDVSAETVVVKRAPISGAKVYKRCAACHLPSGAGVTGAFPPLNGDILSLLNSDLGKEYLVLVAYYGLSGQIEVSGETYSGIMSAQGGMNPAKVAAVLNHVMQDFNGVASDDARLFTDDFVAATKTKYGRLSGAKVHALRDAAYESAR